MSADDLMDQLLGSATGTLPTPPQTANGRGTPSPTDTTASRAYRAVSAEDEEMVLRPPLPPQQPPPPPRAGRYAPYDPSTDGGTSPLMSQEESTRLFLNNMAARLPMMEQMLPGMAQAFGVGAGSAEGREITKIRSYYNATSKFGLVLIHAFITLLLVPCATLRTAVCVSRKPLVSNDKLDANAKIQLGVIAKSAVLDAIGLGVAFVLADLLFKFVIGVPYALVELPLTMLCLALALLSISTSYFSKVTTFSLLGLVVFDTCIWWPLNQSIPVLGAALVMRLITLTLYFLCIIVYAALVDHAMLNAEYPLSRKDYSSIKSLNDDADELGQHLEFITRVQLGMAADEAPSGGEDDDQSSSQRRRRSASRKRGGDDGGMRAFRLVVGVVARLRAQRSFAIQKMMQYAESNEFNATRDLIGSALAIITATTGVGFPCWYNHPLSSVDDSSILDERYAKWSGALSGMTSRNATTKTSSGDTGRKRGSRSAALKDD